MNLLRAKSSPPPLAGTGFIRSLVPTGDTGVLADPQTKSLTRQLCRSALPERHPAWELPDGREPLPGTVPAGTGSGYVSGVTPTYQLVQVRLRCGPASVRSLQPVSTLLYMMWVSLRTNRILASFQADLQTTAAPHETSQMSSLGILVSITLTWQSNLK